MKIITTGHRYELANFENPEKPGQLLQFIEKTPDLDKGNGALRTAQRQARGVEGKASA